MSIPQGSRPPSRTDMEDSNKDGGRKANTDSGFHEDDHSSPTASSLGEKRNYRHHRRKAGEGETTGGDTPKERHDSLASMFSDIQDFSNYMENSSESSSLSSRIKYSASSTSSVQEPSSRVVPNSRHVPGSSSRPPSAHPVHNNAATLHKKGDDDYEFPSDTELSEIIAIMSGIATPRKSLKEGEQARSMDECPSTPVTIHSDHYASSQGLSIDDDGDIVSDLNKAKEGVRLYEKNVANRVSNNKVPNGKVVNGSVPSRRYLPKGVSTESTGSMTSGKGTHVMSLEDILKATQNGKFPDKESVKKNKEKKKEKRPESAAKVEDPPDDQNSKPSWKQRLKVYLTFIVSVGLIVSSSSLLFIVPMFVDPILVGLEAQFSTIPAQCRTIRKRNGTGVSDCAVPTCREGCTADLMFCYFIDVEYQVGILNTAVKSSSNSYLIENRTDEDMVENGTVLSSTHSASRSQGRLQEAVLLVNPNGCGYPPETNCSEFGKKYGRINYTFPCYFSGLNESIVVPYYSHHDEIVHLSVWLLVPCGAAIIFSLILYVLLRWNPTAKRKRKEKEDEELQVLHDKHEDSACNGLEVKLNGQMIHGPDDGTLRLSLNPSLATAPPMRIGNGTLGNIMSDLTGITSNNFIKKRHYAKFKAASMESNGNSGGNSRANSVVASRSNSFEVHNSTGNNIIPEPVYTVEETALNEPAAHASPPPLRNQRANISNGHVPQLARKDSENSRY